jgi:hypothetical protein
LCSMRCRASGVANDLSVSSVGRAVDFDDHSRLKAGEVGHEATKNNLAMESEACDLLASDALPQTLLAACRIASEASRESR